jgi:hypothetical protein
MSVYIDTYNIRYSIHSLKQQIETAVVHAIQTVDGEPPNTPNHAQRSKWAAWANKNTNVAGIPFSWPIAMNSAIAASVAGDPTGASVADADVQSVVNTNLDKVVSDFTANPPPGSGA